MLYGVCNGQQMTAKPFSDASWRLGAAFIEGMYELLLKLAQYTNCD
jgi:hypothetical protein